jgi:hypothetical protein
MIPRLSVSFGLSVLLHGLLLLVLVLGLRAENKDHERRNNAASSKLSVFLEAASSNRKMVALEPTSKKVTRATVPVQPQMQPVAEATRPFATSPPQQFPAPGLFRPPSPGVQQQLQMDYRQMVEAQDRLHAFQQVQFLIAGLQADIEQRINQHGGRAEGECRWRENSKYDAAVLQCDSKVLDSRIKDEKAMLTALRNALRTQGTVLDGFTVGTNTDRAVITYHGHPVNTASEP